MNFFCRSIMLCACEIRRRVHLSLMIFCSAKKIVKGIIRQSMFKHGDFKKFEGALREVNCNLKLNNQNINSDYPRMPKR